MNGTNYANRALTRLYAAAPSTAVWDSHSGHCSSLPFVLVSGTVLSMGSSPNFIPNSDARQGLLAQTLNCTIVVLRRFWLFFTEHT